jgi:hypothetical protein
MDQLTDLNRAGFFQISRAVALPDFVKEAALPDADACQDLRADGFADPRHRRYPLDSRENAWLSCAYFEKFAATQYSAKELASVKTRLQDSAKFWQFEYPQLKSPEAPERPVIKYAMDEQIYAEIPLADDVQHPRRLWEDLQKNAARYPYPMRRSVARQLLKYAADAFVEAEVLALEKTAGYAVATVAGALHLLRGRQQMVVQAEAREKVAAIMAEVEQAGHAGLLTPGMTEKVARLADSIDRLVGQHVRYTPETLPEHQLYSFTAQQFQELNKHAVRLANGAMLTPDQAADGRLRQFVENYTGQKVAQEQLRAKLQELDEHACDLAIQALS